MDKCFACGKPTKKDCKAASTREGQQVFVGTDCYKKISAMTIHGYQAKVNGPRLFSTMLAYCNHIEHGGN